ncbi:hypothetical protein ACLOJK_037335, partial [Asimina triloba]
MTIEGDRHQTVGFKEEKRGKGKQKRKERRVVEALPMSFRFSNAAVNDYGRRLT